MEYFDVLYRCLQSAFNEFSIILLIIFYLINSNDIPKQTYIFVLVFKYVLGSNNEITGHHLGFLLYISNTTSRYGGVLCFRDTNFIRDTLPAVVNISCPHVGRYIIYYNERLPGHTYPSDYAQYTYTALCEVEVYGKIDRFIILIMSYCYLFLIFGLNNSR